MKAPAHEGTAHEGTVRKTTVATTTHDIRVLTRTRHVAAAAAVFRTAMVGLPLPPFGDAFVAKLNPTGTALVYSTYLGGSGDEQGAAIAVDASGGAYVGGGHGHDARADWNGSLRGGKPGRHRPRGRGTLHGDPGFRERPRGIDGRRKRRVGIIRSEWRGGIERSGGWLWNDRSEQRLLGGERCVGNDRSKQRLLGGERSGERCVGIDRCHGRRSARDRCRHHRDHGIHE